MKLINGNQCDEDIEIDISNFLDVKFVDNGIGAYEFHGQKCVDKKIEGEIQNYSFQVDYSSRMKGMAEESSVRMILTGTVEADDEKGHSCSIDWKAKLIGFDCKTYIATYEIKEK